jgi:glycosyltransferase involved in cell wall biosynthesis
MGYGNCIVASDIVEAREVVGEAALTFVGGDPAALAAQLERVLGDAELAEELRGRALARVREKYNWDDVAAAHRKVYERLSPPRTR